MIAFSRHLFYRILSDQQLAAALKKSRDSLIVRGRQGHRVAVLRGLELREIELRGVLSLPDLAQVEKEAGEENPGEPAQVSRSARRDTEGDVRADEGQQVHLTLIGFACQMENGKSKRCIDVPKNDTRELRQRS